LKQLFSVCLVLAICTISQVKAQIETITYCKNCDNPREIKVSLLDSFLDSVANLNSEQLGRAVNAYYDSTYRQKSTVGITLSKKDFNLLKESIENGEVHSSSFEQIFSIEPDPSWIYEGQIALESFVFKGSEQDPIEFAIVAGAQTSWEGKTFFFIRNQLFEIHEVFHKGNYEISHYTGPEGNTIVHYLRNHGRGTGISQYNHCFYEFTESGLRPVLNLIQTGVLYSGGSHRNFNIHLRKSSSTPLIFDSEYNSAIWMDDFEEYAVIDSGSVNLQYVWDQKENTYKANSQNKLSNDQLLSFYLEGNPLLFINVYYDRLKHLIENGSAQEQGAVYQYLYSLKSDLEDKF